MAVASGSLRRCWRPAAALHRAAHTGRAEPLRAEDLAERLRARKSEEEKREVSDEPGRWGGIGGALQLPACPAPLPGVPRAAHVAHTCSGSGSLVPGGSGDRAVSPAGFSSRTRIWGGICGI